MTHKIIKNKDYLLVVDDSEIKVGDYFYSIRGIVEQAVIDYFKNEHHGAIIAHLPLNGSPILKDVSLLPPIEDDVEQMAKEEAEKLHDKNRHEDWDIYDELVSDDAELIKIGYNKAREKYKYTEEDMRKAWNAAYIDALAIDEDTYTPLFFDYFIQSLHQYPTEFETEDVLTPSQIFYPNDVPYSSPKTITTTQGIQWVGKYK